MSEIINAVSFDKGKRWVIFVLLILILVHCFFCLSGKILNDGGAAYKNWDDSKYFVLLAWGIFAFLVAAGAGWKTQVETIGEKIAGKLAGVDLTQRPTDTPPVVK